MAADIMLLANTIVYDGQLRCGADHVAEAVLDLQVAPSQISHPQWLNQVSFQPSFCVHGTVQSKRRRDCMPPLSSMPAHEDMSAYQTLHLVEDGAT